MRSWGLQKPPAGSTIDWGHPLAQGLIVCSLFNERGGTPKDLFSGQTWVPQPFNTAPWRPLGYHSGSSASTGNGALAVYARRPAAVGSVLWRGVFLGAGVSNSVVFGSDSINSPFVAGLSIFRTCDTSQNNIDFNINRDGTGTDLDVAANLSSRYFMPAQFVGTSRTGDQRLYDGPHLIGSGTQAYTAFSYPAATFLQNGSLQVVASRYTNAVTIQGCIWDRVLRPEEVAWLAVEPYAFIAPPGPKVIYFDLGGVTPSTWKPKVLTF